MIQNNKSILVIIFSLFISIIQADFSLDLKNFDEIPVDKLSWKDIKQGMLDAYTYSEIQVKTYFAHKTHTNDIIPEASQTKNVLNNESSEHTKNKEDIKDENNEDENNEGKNFNDILQQLGEDGTANGGNPNDLPNGNIPEPENSIISRLTNLAYQNHRQLAFIGIIVTTTLAILFPQKTKSIFNKTKSTITILFEKIKEKLWHGKSNKDTVNQSKEIINQSA